MITQWIPRVIRIGPYDFDVIQWDKTEGRDRSNLGECSTLKLEIRIDTSLNCVHILDSLIHEINHGIFYAYGLQDSDAEERVCTITATAMVQVYRDNPDLIKFIQRVMKEIRS